MICSTRDETDDDQVDDDKEEGRADVMVLAVSRMLLCETSLTSSSSVRASKGCVVSLLVALLVGFAATVVGSHRPLWTSILAVGDDGPDDVVGADRQNDNAACSIDTSRQQNVYSDNPVAVLSSSMIQFALVLLSLYVYERIRTSGNDAVAALVVVKMVSIQPFSSTVVVLLALTLSILISLSMAGVPNTSCAYCFSLDVDANAIVSPSSEPLLLLPLLLSSVRIKSEISASSYVV